LYQVTQLATGNKFAVGQKRAGRFLHKMDKTAVAKVLTAPCCKKRNCHSHFTSADVYGLRADVYGQYDSNKDENNYLVLRLGRPSAKSPFRYMLGEREVCGKFWMMAYGVWAKRAAKLRALATHSATDGVMGFVGGLDFRGRPPTKMNACLAFLGPWFDLNAQKPTPDEWLWPIHVPTAGRAWEEDFKPWWKIVAKANHWSDNDMPGKKTFERACANDLFKHVKKRKKHNHCRCLTCDDIEQEGVILQRGNDPRAIDAWKVRKAAHKKMYRAWRQYEAACILRAHHAPHEQWCCEYDDTSAAALPSLTKRPPKNLTNTRISLIPFNYVNPAADQLAYIWTVKGAYKKGGNRLCSTLYHTWRAGKEGEGEHRFARDVTCIADNYTENKCNTVLAFGCLLVSKNWFDTIKFVYGPVGHTHGGQDRNHNILNNHVLGGHQVGTLGHIACLSKDAWSEQRLVPEHVVNEAMYDWDKYFGNSILDGISGCWKTPRNEEAVHAFLIKRGTHGVVEVRWKPDAATGDWLGVGGRAGDAGFRLLKSIPRGVPDIIPPKNTTNIIAAQYVNSFNSHVMKGVMEKRGLGSAHDHLMEIYKTGTVPRTFLEDTRPLGKLGRLAKTGVDSYIGEVRIMEPCMAKNADDFFAQPPALLEAIKDKEAREKAAVAQHALPPVGYTRIPHDKRPVVVSGLALTRAQEDERLLAREAAVQKQGYGSDGIDGNEEEEEEEEGEEVADDNPCPREAFGDWCAPGRYVAIKTDWDDKGGMEIGKITSVVSAADKTFQATFLTNIAPWLETCIDGKWHTQPGSKPQQCEAHTVVCMFDKINKDNTLPKKVRDCLKGSDLNFYMDNDGDR